jgi:hypothetical protein
MGLQGLQNLEKTNIMGNPLILDLGFLGAIEQGMGGRLVDLAIE